MFFNFISYLMKILLGFHIEVLISQIDELREKYNGQIIVNYNFGKFRIYVFIGVFLGVTIYALTISKVFIYFMTYILHNLRMFVKKTNKLLKNGARQVKIRVITAKKIRIGKK